MEFNQQNSNQHRFQHPAMQNNYSQWNYPRPDRRGREVSNVMLDKQPKMNFNSSMSSQITFTQNSAANTGGNRSAKKQSTFRPVKGKRAHEQEPAKSADSSTSSEDRNLNLTSPAAKKQIQRRERQSATDNNNGKVNKNPQKKNTENSPANLIRAQKEKEWSELFAYTLTALKNCTPGEEVNTLLYNLQNSRSYCVALKKSITDDLQKLMSPLGVKEILVFGSTLTGLDFKGSDLDFHIQLLKQPANEDEVKHVIQRAGRLTSMNYDFRVIYSIQFARVPLIRLVHHKTKTTCDINFTSRFGYYNSYFIGHVLSYDTRIKDLATILKLWSKAYKVAEKMIMSNYCLTMLMIFYLQNLEHPMLTTIKKNQEGKRPIIIDPKFRWNIFFNNSINRSHENQQTTRELLYGFFEFYHKLNYRNYILSLYNGDLIAREDFATHPDFEEYRKIVAESKLQPLRYDNPEMFIVQDGFEQNLNIGIKTKQHHEFFSLIKDSHELLKQLKDEPLSTLLIKLFTELKVPETVGEKKAIEKAKRKFYMKIHATAGELKLCQDILRAQDSNQIYSEADQTELFFKHVCEGTTKFLSEVYLCTVTHQQTEAEPDPMKQEIAVTLQFDCFNSRKKMSFRDEATMNAEIETSKKMSERKVPIELEFNMTISSKNKGKTVELDMADSKVLKKSSLPTFGTFLGINLPSALNCYLKKKCENTIL